MIFRRALSCTLAAAAAALIGIALVSCGGDSEASGGSSSYTEVLNGLNEAALEGKTYKAARRAKELPKPQRYMVESFCYMAWQIPVNREAHKLAEHAYIVTRLRIPAERDLNGPNSANLKNPKIGAALDELRSIIDLESLDGNNIRGYSKACYS